MQFKDKHLAQFSGDFAGENDIVLVKNYHKYANNDIADGDNYSDSEAGRAGRFLGLGHDYVPGDPGL